jgi:DNA polymerase V
MKFYILVDCNSFYASCERIFRPDLLKKPVAVLSNNDGCVVAMSKEVKAAGVERGAPYFKVKDALKAADAEVFSSNYALYQDISNRVMMVLSRYSDQLEVYSIDEAFISFEGCAESVLAIMRDACRDVYRETGVVVSAGAAPTRTLAKAASRIVKKGMCDNGYGLFSKRCFVLEADSVEHYLKKIGVGELWGIGRAGAEKLHRIGVVSAYDLSKAEPLKIKKLLTVTGFRTWRELNGYDAGCDLPVSEVKSVTTSLSFPEVLYSRQDLERVLADYCRNVVVKLNSAGMRSRCITLFVTTGRHDENYYANGSFVRFAEVTDYLPDFVKAGNIILSRIYRSGVAYRKLGVVLTELECSGKSQCVMHFSEEEEISTGKKLKLAEAAAELSQRYGRYALTTLQGVGPSHWKMHRELLSPSYTTDWNSLPVVK